MPTTLHRQKLMLAMAKELGEVRTLLERLAEELVCDVDMIDKHLEKLQQFDIISQHVDECGRLLGRMADGMTTYEALGKVGLGGLQARLARALPEG
ncbi:MULTISPECIES: hypothetical protein [unclassified Sphingomonas]|jgi:hypothetical protein|uniref:hypothetical protein n=1 Tax=unclassified Sphingomonas TaxID=196159 RepID=UPI001F593BE7|nr:MULTISPECIES: hypothetical protein [unclassified Sphingomonas]